MRSLAGGYGVPDGVARRPARELERRIIALAQRREKKPVAFPIKEAAEALEPLRRILDKSEAAGSITALVDTIELVTRPRVLIAGQIAADYPNVQLFTPALVDFEHWHDAEGPATGFKEQLVAHRDVALAYAKRGGPYFHHYAPYNPLRDIQNDGASLELVKLAIEKYGFIGAKVYPPTGFLPINNERLSSFRDRRLGAKLDERLRAFYKYCAAEDVPILAHANESNAFGPGFGWRATPWGWGAVLEEYALRVDLGHFGHMRGVVDDDTEFECSCWSRQIADLMNTHEHVYADISNSELYRDAKYRAAYVKLLQRRFSQFGEGQNPVGGRIMYGSDWWMLKFRPDPAKDFHDSFSRFFADHFQAHQGRFLSRNALAFLGIRKADGTFDDCNKNRTRLREFYQRHEVMMPAWLGPEAGLCVF